MGGVRWGSGWKRKRGRTTNGALTEAQAAARMLELIAAHEAEQSAIEENVEERRRRGNGVGRRACCLRRLATGARAK